MLSQDGGVAASRQSSTQSNSSIGAKLASKFKSVDEETSNSPEVGGASKFFSLGYREPIITRRRSEAHLKSPRIKAIEIPSEDWSVSQDPFSRQPPSPNSQSFTATPPSPARSRMLHFGSLSNLGGSSSANIRAQSLVEEDDYAVKEAEVALDRLTVDFLAPSSPTVMSREVKRRLSDQVCLPLILT